MTHKLVSLFTLATLAATFASSQPFPARIDLGAIPLGEGFVLEGEDSADDAGYRVAGIGDFNDDGFDDVAVSAIAADPNGSSSGSVYVFLGATAANLSNFDLGDLDGTNGFRIDGLTSSDQLGFGLAGTGDINDDGIDDLLVGAIGGDANGSNAGEVYALFGRKTFPAVVNLNTLNGTNGARIDGVDAFDNAGVAVAGAGDFNGDGIDDFVIGADEGDPNGSGSGEVYVGFGRVTWPATLKLSTLNGETGFVIRGVNTGDNAGWSVGKAGDVNGDGLADIIIGAQFADPNGSSSGESYLVFGRTGVPPSVELEDLDGISGVALSGRVSFDYSGYSVSGLGDVNGDGFDDVVIGAYSADPNGSASGQAYIVYGRDSWNATLELDDLDGVEGVILNGINASDQMGRSVFAAGDFNGDGFFDTILGAPFADPNGTSSGEAYVAFGSDVLPATVELDDINGTNGVTFEGPTGADESGWSVGFAGDFNGDGVDDVIIGGPEGNGSTGFAHVAFGRYETGVTFGATGGACPGPISLRAKGLTPDSQLEIYRGSGRGSSTIQTGACAGSELDLADAQLIRIADSNALGQFLLKVTINNPNICGTDLQVIDLSTCDESNLTAVPSD